MGTDSLTSDKIRLEVSSGAAKYLAPRQMAVFQASPFPLKYPADIEIDLDADPLAAPQSPRQIQIPPLFSAVKRTLMTKWFWYAMASSLCWTGWAFTAKIGSREIPPTTMEFISAFGFVLVSLGSLGRKTAKTDKSRAGKCCALFSGVLLALGGICLYGLYRTGHNASIVTAITSLYPMVTVLFAVAFLREKLNKVQVVGLFFAAAAMFILSL
jgi:bacterial/archaeal transporter family protein